MRRLAVVLWFVPVAAFAAPSTVLYRHAADARPAFVAGDLAGPTTLAPAAAARAFLRAADHLAPVDRALLGAATVRHLQRGTVVRFALEHAGLPVVGGGVAVRLDEQGRVRMVLGSPIRIDPAAAARPVVGAAAARRALAATHAAQRALQLEHATVRLVWAPAPDGTLRLAWEFRLPPTPVLAEALLYRVDAQTGALLAARNLVRFADQAKVYATNPVTSALTTVTLPTRAPNDGQPADALSNPYVNVLNCQDNHSLTPLSLGGYDLSVHLCDELSTVVRDTSGDYLAYGPASPDAWGADPAANPADEDPFSEVQMYYHVMTAYQYFQGLGDPAFTELDAKPIQATVNFRIPFDMEGGGFDLINATNPSGVLYAFPNAFFMPAGQIIPGLNRPASMVFGQARTADFAYDGDVVFHEFTHGVIWSTSDLMGPGVDEQGLDPAPGGMNEGFADIFSSFITGDGQSGEYAGAAFGLATGIRDLTQKYRCPDLLWGEVHQDSMALAGAVWSIYEQLGHAVEAPIFAVLVALPPDASFALAAAAIEAELDDALGVDAAAVAHAALQEANLFDCQRVIEYTAPRAILYTEGTSLGLSPMPGYLQFKYVLAERATALHVQFGYSAGATSMFGGGSPAYTVYVRQGAPITWTYGMTGATATGTRDYELALEGLNNNATFAGDLAVALDPGDYYLQIVSTGAAGGALRNVAISHEAAPQDDAGTPPDDAGIVDETTGGRGGGCGCRTTAPARGGLLALLGLALLVRRRRR